MSSIYDGDAADIKKYIKLCQFYRMLQNSNGCADGVNALTIMCKKGFDINYSIPINSHMCQKQPKLLGYTALHLAAMKQDVQMTAALLERGADFTMRNHNGDTALRMAVNIRYEPFGKLSKKISHKYDLAHVILDYHVRTGNTMNPACNGGITHFYLACIVNHTQAIQFFLDNGASITDVVSLPKFLGFTALHFAAMFCNYKAVKILLSRGADASIADANGCTPLHWLIKRRMEMRERPNAELMLPFVNNQDVIILILEKSFADGIVNPVDGVGLSHLHVAMVCTPMYKKQQILKKILEYVKNVDAVINLNSPICAGYTPLHFAAAFDMNSVKSLISRGANMLAKDAKGITPLDICLKHWNYRAVHWMLSHNESPKEISFSNGSKLLDFVLTVDEYDSLKVLLEAQLDVNAYIPHDSPLWPGYTPLHLAVVFENQINIKLKALEYREYSGLILRNSPVNVCLQYNSNCMARDANGLTPVHLAFKLRNKEIVGRLLEHQSFKADRFFSINELEGVSCLHIVCAIRKSSIVKRLLNSGADVNETTKADFVWYNSADEATLVKAGSTPLHILVSLGGFNIVATLLSSGADPTIRDARGLTSIHLAHILRAPRFVVELLLSGHTFEKTNAITRGGLSHLHVACAHGDRSTLQKYLQLDGVDVNAPIINENDMNEHSVNDDEDDNFELHAYQQYWSTHAGYTPLHFIVDKKYSNFRVIELLLKQGVDMTARNTAATLSPLHLSILQLDYMYKEAPVKLLGHLYVRLKEQYGDGFIDDVGLTLLHVACQLRNADEVKRLLEADADVNARVHADSPIFPCDTPLHMAVRWFVQISFLEEQKKEIIKILIEHGADINAVNSEGITPLQLAQMADIYRQSSGKDVCVVDALLTYDPMISLANPTRLYGTSHFYAACGWRDGARIIEEYLNRGIDRCIINRPVNHFANSYTPLHIAAATGSAETVRVLLHHGADIWMEDFLGMTPLHIVAHYRCSTDLDEALSGRLDKISALASFGGSEYVNARTVLGKTALDLCFENGHNASAASLLNLGARTVTRNPVSGTSTWTLAYKMGQFNMMMKSARDITELDENGASALQAIVEYNWTIEPSVLEVISRLLDAGCELDHQDQKGRTALHIATKSDNDLALTALLQSGAEVNITDNKCQTAFDLCNQFSTDTPILYSYAYAMRSVGLKVICSTRKTFVPNYNHFQHYAELNTLQREFLSEQAIQNFPTMIPARRETIRLAVEGAESMPFTGLLKMQYRRALARMQLRRPAVQQLVQLLGLPDLCCDIIFFYLSTQDVRRLFEPCSMTNVAVTT